MAQFANVTEGLRFRIVLCPGVALGPGKADLLGAIADTNSITAAAIALRHELQARLEPGARAERGLRRAAGRDDKGGTGGGGSARLTPLGGMSSTAIARWRRTRRP